jgi:hypothetical protein
MRVSLPKDYPDHHDADLVLRTYDLRREPVLREARRTLMIDFWPKGLEDLLAVSRWDHPQNEAFRQVTAYWELVYGMARHGIVHPEYLAESSGGEALILLAKVFPFLAEFRKTASPRFLTNTEWVARETAYGREAFDTLRPQVDQMRGAR